MKIIDSLLINAIYLFKCGRTRNQLAKMYSRIVCLDLTESVGLETCLLSTSGVTVEFKLDDRSYYINDNDGLTVTEALWKNGLIYYNNIMGKGFCFDYQWAKLLIAANLELSRRDYYAKREKELYAGLGGF